MRRTCATIGVVLAPKRQNPISPVLIAPIWMEGIVGTSLQWLSTMCAEECSLLDGTNCKQVKVEHEDSEG